jgi:1-phosphofructokinase
MIATLTLNPSLDLTVSLKKVDLRDINRVPGIQRDPGGKGINISRIIRRIKGNTVAYGFVGGCTGTKICELMKKEGVRTDFVRIAGDNRSNISIEVTGKCGQIKINEDGPSVKESDFRKLFLKLSALTRGDYLIISGSIPGGTDKNIYARIIRLMRRTGTKTALDSDGEPFFRGVKENPFLIKPNIFEAGRLLEKITGRVFKIYSEEDLAEAASILACQCEIAIISWGARGIIAASKSRLWRLRPPVKLKRSGVGSGDAVIAGFMQAYSNNAGIEESLRQGIACGTASSIRKGTALCRPADVSRLAQKTTIKSLHSL